MLSTISSPKSRGKNRVRHHPHVAHTKVSKQPRARALSARKHHESTATRHSDGATPRRRSAPKILEPRSSVSVRERAPDESTDVEPRALETRHDEHREHDRRHLDTKGHEAAPVAEPEGERPRYDANSALNLYLREIARTPLLTIQEEVDLAKRIKKGDKKAREQMIKANLRLVVKIARDYENYGLPLLDLINEGNIGGKKAVERFDPAKGAKFSTYGAWWIKQSIKRATGRS